MIQYILVAASVTLLCYAFYLLILSIEWDDAEVRELERLELQLGHILSMLDAPDVRMLIEDPESRQDLMLQFSQHLKEDVLQLTKLRGLRFSSVPLVLAFFLSYYMIRLKARFICSRNDLRFLSALELAIFRLVR
jgi:hypothetical protein